MDPGDPVVPIRPLGKAARARVSKDSLAVRSGEQTSVDRGRSAAEADPEPETALVDAGHRDG
jgi:hypothetical protein